MLEAYTHVFKGNCLVLKEDFSCNQYYAQQEFGIVGRV